MKLKLNDSELWIRIMVSTPEKIPTSKCTDINKKVISLLEKQQNQNLNDFLQMAIFGKLSSEIYHSIKKISPIKRVEIEEIKLL